MKDLIGRCLTLMGVSGVSVEDIHDMLIGEGLSEYDAYLTYKGAELIYNSRNH